MFPSNMNILLASNSENNLVNIPACFHFDQYNFNLATYFSHLKTNNTKKKPKERKNLPSYYLNGVFLWHNLV